MATRIYEGERANVIPLPKTKGMAWAWYAVTLLLLVQWMNSVDRNIIAVILQPIKIEFHLSDTQLGALSAICYAISYSIAAMPLGMLADRVNRAKLLSALLVGWSAVTLFTGLAQNYTQLILARMGLAVFEAGSQPTGLAMIADIFPSNRRATAVGIFMLSVPLSGLVGITLTGYIAHRYGWRAPYFVLGLPGIAIAILVALTLRDPRSAATKQALAVVQAGQAQSEDRSLKAIFHTFVVSPSLLHTLLGTIFMTCSAAGFMIWMTSFLIRTHGMNLAAAAAGTGLTAGFSGLIGVPCGGWALACAPLIAASIMVQNAPLAVGLIVVWSLIQAIGQAPAYSLFASLAPRHMRGAVVSTLSIATNGLAYGLGPPIIGVLSDLFEPAKGHQSLRYALLAVVAFKIASGIFYLVGARTVHEDLVRAAAA